ncbi:divergent polysaccharide deacetylase family protein [Amphritea japonica]|uniref:Divergent polysaccharide deacetylase family protein n=1 Tax=Amphritea japonica ATCC BAA-1530 TaxID=1278309 RepID=A0A7R6P8J8_9GAMM|nr:divergent polysaccharide deacetylase family protein [Amphritea japonica]BBB25402.1 conserved hypothetical protein [Amphritea japonica ATCC BAA-1530]
MSYILVGLALLAMIVRPVAAETVLPRLVVIVDDMGNNLKQGVAAINLPGPVAYSVLPHTPHSVALAEMAYGQGKEVMLHAPMANTARLKLGPGGLTEDMTRQQLQSVLRSSIAAVPYVSGVNNHMGSLLTQKRQKMDWVMDVLAEQGLYFLDSKTTTKSMAWKSAYSQGIPWLVRDVFLDHEQTTEFVDKQFRYGLRLAREQGFAVLICHPYPVTIEYLKHALPRIGEQGIQLVSPGGFLLQQAEARRLVEAQQAERDICNQGEGLCEATLAHQDGSRRSKSE